MKINQLLVFSFFISSFLFVTSCKKGETCPSKITSTEKNVVSYYNAFFDLFFTIENFDHSQLEIEGILIDEGANNEYQRRYSLTFPDGYQDENGNSIEGNFYFQATLLENNPGNQTTFEFDNFFFNGLQVDGAKFSENSSSSTESAVNIDWCTDEEGIAITLDNGEVVIFHGCLDKTVREIFMEVNGTNSISINDENFEVEISKQLVKEKDCFWFTSGELTIHSANQAKLNFTASCENPTMIIADAESCSSETITQIHHLW